jgi:hypothetical protein
MLPNQISAFEYVSILISIILGLGITQILSSFSDLLYNHKHVKFYWPHLIWIVFILFLHFQDWFITYQVKDIKVWSLPKLLFIIAYPITLFLCAKMLLPTNETEEREDMKKFYFSQFPVIFILVGISILFSLIFNFTFLGMSVKDQLLQCVFLATISYFSIAKIKSNLLHKILSITILIATLVSILFENNEWVIN